MVEGPGRQPDLHALLHERLEVGPHRPGNDWQVRSLGQEDVDANAPERRDLERRGHGRVGNEVRGHDRDASLRAGERPEQRESELVEVLVRPVGDSPREHVTRRLQRREPSAALEHLARAVEPVGGERLLELRDDGSHQPEVEVLDRAPAFGERVALADVHPARERHRSIDDGDLPMGAKVQREDQGRDATREERDRAHAPRVQEGKHGGEAVASTGGIDEHPHGDAAILGACEHVDELAPDAIVVEDVGAPARRRRAWRRTPRCRSAAGRRGSRRPGARR